MPAHSWPEKRIQNTLAIARSLHLGRRGPFLWRNLSKALDHHQHALEAQNRSLANDTPSTLPQNPVIWNFPDEQIASIVASHRDAVLHINLEALRPKTSTLNDSIERPDSLLFTMECQLVFTLFRKDNSVKWKHAAKYQDFRWATIKAFRNGNAIIDMEDSLKITARTFWGLEMQHQQNGPPVKQFGSQYSLRTAIKCRSASDNQTLLQFVGLDQQGISCDQEVRASWHHLPKCPNEDEGLALQLAKLNGPQSSHTLQVGMGWVAPTMSRVMKEISYEVREYESGNGGKALAADATDESTRPKLPRTTYRYGHVKSPLQHQRMVVQGYKCGFCSMRLFKEMLHLQLHLRLDHDRFVFTFKESSLAPHAAPDLHIEFTIVDGAEKQRSESLGNIQWIAPDRPFDIRAHLAGDESWIGGKMRKPPAGARLAALNASKRKKPEEVPDLPKPVRKRYKVPRIQDNKDLRLWAMHSRRPLSEGEEISEDDDSLAPSHLVSKIPHRIEKDPRLPRAAVHFMTRWNAHMAEERLDADRYLGDAVVRFFRHNGMWLRNTPGMLQEYLKKIGELNEDGLIDTEVYEFCKAGLQTNNQETDNKANEKIGEKRKRSIPSEGLDPSCLPGSLKKMKISGIEKKMSGVETIHGKENSTAVRVPPSNTPAKGSVLKTSLAMRESWPGETKTNAASLGKQETNRPTASGSGICACVCGKSVSAIDWQEAISCANAACPRRDFHLACLKLDQRIAGWKCDDCTTRDAV
ncbi:hypothetical protein HDK77DRAFT_116922 [Phyllosticta capitalensis]